MGDPVEVRRVIHVLGISMFSWEFDEARLLQGKIKESSS